MAVADPFEWGAEDDITWLAPAAEQRHQGRDGGQHHRPYGDDAPLDTPAKVRMALARVTEFQAVFPDWEDE